jgi:hypothetical protein
MLQIKEILNGSNVQGLACFITVTILHIIITEKSAYTPLLPLLYFLHCMPPLNVLMCDIYLDELLFYFSF